MTAPIIYLDMVRADRARQRQDAPAGHDVAAAFAEAVGRTIDLAEIERINRKFVPALILGTGPEAA